MKRTNLFIGCTVALMLCFFYSCKSDDFIPSVEVTTSEATDLMSLKDYGYYETLHLDANTDWKIKCDGDWFYTLPSEGGSGKHDVKLCVTDNASATKNTGTLIITFSNGDKKEIKLQQNGKVGDNGAMPVPGYKQYAVGHGYNYFGRAANPASVGKQIFDVTSLIEDQVLLQNPSSSHFESEVITGSCSREISAKLSIDAGIEGKYMGFSGEVSASFDAAYTSSGNYEFAIYSGKSVQTEWYLDSNLDDLIHNYMIPGAEKAINGSSSKYQGADGIKNLIKDYGTHVVMKAYLGGKYSIKLAVDRSQITSDYDIGAYAKAAYKNAFVDANVSVDANYSNSYKENENACHATVDILGGSAESKASSAIKSNGGLDKWEQSLLADNYKNCALMDFDDNSLVPIWELCSDADGKTGLETERGKAIKAYILGDYYSSVEVKSPNSEAITIPNFNSNATTLVKTARLAVGQNQIAEICNEFIPALSMNSRVTVVYPVLNGVPRYDAGLFIGNSEHHPATVRWNGSNCSISEIDSLPKMALKTIYKQGLSFSTVPYSDKNATVVTDQYFGDLDEFRGFDYPMVKIGGYVWLRTDYRSIKHGTSTLSTIWRDGKGSFFVTAGQVFYDVYCLFDPSKGGKLDPSRLEPVNWYLPSNTDYKALISFINNNSQLLIPNGLTGLNLSQIGHVYSQDNLAPWLREPSHSNVTTALWTSDASIFELNSGQCLVVDPSDKGFFGCNVRLIRKAGFKYY